MNTAALQTLAERWPNDTVKNDRSGISDVGNLLFGASGQSIYEDRLQLDEQDSKAIASFAADNGLSYTPRTTEFRQTKFAGNPPAWIGHQIKTTQPVFAHVVSGEISGFPAQIFVGYTAAAVQSGRRDSDIKLNAKSYIKVTLPTFFPQMVLDSNKNDRGITGSMPASFKPSQKLHLEGDFPTYFDFYAPLGLQVNTLTVLAPNFMQIIKDSAHTFDVEFFGKEMVLVTHEPIYTPEVMDVALKALDEQLRYLQRLLPSWNYQPINPPFDMLQKTTWQGQSIKIGQLRLSPGQVILVILGGFVLYAILILVLKHYFPET